MAPGHSRSLSSPMPRRRMRPRGTTIQRRNTGSSLYGSCGMAMPLFCRYAPVKRRPADLIARISSAASIRSISNWVWRRLRRSTRHWPICRHSLSCGKIGRSSSANPPEGGGLWHSPARIPPGVRAIVNFSGGRGGHAGNRPGVNCAPEKLVAAAAHFGASARVPSLWLYAGNDSYFSPALSRQMADAWRAAGGKAEYNLLPPQRDEGHFFVEYPESSALWSKKVESFLARAP